MTDRRALLEYRLQEAEETLADAEKMIETALSPRSIINRAYYAMFYAILALFLHRDINPKTSKHSGVISIFDREFVHAGSIDAQYSKALHKMFDARQQADYKELVTVSAEDAAGYVTLAKDFVQALKTFIGKQPAEN